jgi:hypothetical protein
LALSREEKIATCFLKTNVSDTTSDGGKQDHSAVSQRSS